MKQRNGEVVEEFICTTRHLIEDDEVIDHLNESNDGEYTGIFWFEYLDGRITRRYTRKTAPKWLLEYYELATT